MGLRDDLFFATHVSFLHEACARLADVDGEGLEDGGDCRGAHGVARDEAQRRHKVEDWLGSARLPSGADGVASDHDRQEAGQEAERRMRRATERRPDDAELKTPLPPPVPYNQPTSAPKKKRVYSV